MSKIMNYADILQQQKTFFFFNSHATKDLDFRKAQLQKLKKVVKKAMKNYCMMPFIKISGSLNLKLWTEISFIYKDIDYYLKFKIFCQTQKCSHQYCEPNGKQ